MAQVSPAGSAAGEGDFQRLGLAMAPPLGRAAEFLSDSLDDVQAEAAKISFYHRAAARQQQQQAAWLQKRRQENMARRAAEEEPLPEEVPGLFKPLPEPSQLDNVLLANQMDAYTDAVNSIGGAGLQKLFLLNSLQQTAGT
jgi:translation initiation factor 3 subunit H